MKIAIYEDGIFDCMPRYGSLLKDHELYLSFFTHFPLETSVRMLSNEGFKPVSITKGSLDVIEADLHLVDGLQGVCKQLLPILPKDDSYLVSTMYSLRDWAIENCYHVFDAFRIPLLVDKIKKNKNL